MMLRNAKSPADGQPAENCFEITDEKTGEKTGMCAIYTGLYPNLFPTRPHMIRIRIEGDPSGYDRLIGAAMARAQFLASQTGLPARIFAECDPDDEDLFRLLHDIGMRNDDGLIRMRADVPSIRKVDLPGGCELFRDDLKDLGEQTYFLERYNKIYRAGAAEEWINEYISHPMFRRFMCVNSAGIISEAVGWVDGRTGVIDFVTTAHRNRGHGYARIVLREAMNYFRECDCLSAACVVRAKWPYAIRTFEGLGFYQSELIMRYPGIDYDP